MGCLPGKLLKSRICQDPLVLATERPVAAHCVLRLAYIECFIQRFLWHQSGLLSDYSSVLSPINK